MKYLYKTCCRSFLKTSINSSPEKFQITFNITTQSTMSSVTTDTAVTSVPNTAKDELSILRVHTYDRTAGIATQERVLQVLSAELQNAKNGTLKELRGVLIAKNVFNSRT